MGQIVKCFAQLDPVCPLLVFEALHPLSVLFKFNSQAAPDSDPMFSKRRIAETLTYGYLEMLGTLSKHKEGIESVLCFLILNVPTLIFPGFSKTTKYLPLSIT